MAPTFLFLSPPNSKCLHLLMASILLDLQLGSTHSSLNTIFFVVLAWKDSTSNQSDFTHWRHDDRCWMPTYLLSENRLRLTTIPALLSVVSPLTCRTCTVQLPVIQLIYHTEALTIRGLFTLCIEGILSLLVLGNFVGLVLLALLAVGSAGLRHVHLDNKDDKHICNIPGSRLKVHSDWQFGIWANFISKASESN